MMLLSGLFLNQERKDNFLKNLEGEKYFFDASRRKVYESFLFRKYLNVEYVPQYCFMFDIRSVFSVSFLLSFWTVDIDKSLMRSLYKKELLIARFRYDPYQNLFRSRFFRSAHWVIRSSVFALRLMLLPITALVPFLSAERIFTSAYEGTNNKSTKFDSFWLRIRFVLGYRYCAWLFDKKIDLGSFDKIYHWGPNWTTSLILKRYAEKNLVPFINVEFGEIDNTFSLNQIGMFGDSDFYRDIDAIFQRELTKEEVAQGDEVLAAYRGRYASSIPVEMLRNREWGKFQNDISRLDMLRESFEKVIYVSGVELLYSGWIFSRSNSFKGNPNQLILELVSEAVDLEKTLILFREHPLLIEQTSSLACDLSDLPNVVNVSSYPFSYVMKIADIVVSLPSKVQLEALIIGKSVISFGPCVAPEAFKIQRYVQLKDCFEMKSIDVREALDSLESEPDTDAVEIDRYVRFLNVFNTKPESRA